MGERRLLVAVVASAIIVVLVAVLVALYGVRGLPDFPSLAEQPDPSIPGTIAWSRAWTGDEEGPCVWSVEASGDQPEQVACLTGELAWLEQLAWTSEGEVVAIGPTSIPDGELGAIVIGADGDITTRGTIDPDDIPDDQVRADGARLRVTGFGAGQSRVQIQRPDGGIGPVVTVEDAPRYSFTRALWSPDGAWVVIVDSEGRLLVAPAEERVEARLLAGDDGDDVPSGHRHVVSWHIPGEQANVVSVDPAP